MNEIKIILAMHDNDDSGMKLCIRNFHRRADTFTGGYTFEGLLKVSVTTADGTINSKFYPMRADLDKNSIPGNIKIIICIRNKIRTILLSSCERYNTFYSG
jgi:hypothetical protein